MSTLAARLRAQVTANHRVVATLDAAGAAALRDAQLAFVAAHADWLDASIGVEELTRAHRLAATMLELGDDPSLIEHHLVALGVSDAVAAEVADNATRLGEELRQAG